MRSVSELKHLFEVVLNDQTINSVHKSSKEAGKYLDLPVIDHIIISGEDGCFSFVDEGLL